jgi:hypothetical protein
MLTTITHICRLNSAGPRFKVRLFLRPSFKHSAPVTFGVRRLMDKFQVHSCGFEMWLRKTPSLHLQRGCLKSWAPRTLSDLSMAKTAWDCHVYSYCEFIYMFYKYNIYIYICVCVCLHSYIYMPNWPSHSGIVTINHGDNNLLVKSC